MPISNYPNGFANGVNIRGVPLLNTYGGKVFWVDSGAGSDSNKGTFDRPFSTIDYAIGQCTADNGDIIMVKPGHSEAISTADIDADVAGISIIGLGAGSNRPTITYTGTTDTTTFDVSANNILIHNLLFSFTDNDAVDNAMVINGTDVEVSNCEFRATSDDQPDTFITIGLADNDADRAHIHDCKFISLTAGANNAISIDFDMDGLRIESNWIDGDWVDAGIDIPAGGNACTNLRIENNYIRNRQTGDHAVQIAAVTSGFMKNNTLVADTVDIIVSPVANMVYLENYGSIADAATTGPGGGSFPVPAHMYGSKARAIVRKQTGSMASGYGTADDPALFTVTGVIMARVWGVVTTAITSTGGTGTLSVGTSDANVLFVPAITMDGTNGAQHDILSNATTTVNGDVLESDGNWAIIANGVDIQAFIATNDMTAGAVDFFCEWYPLSVDGRVISA